MEKTAQRGALCSVLLTRHYSGDQIKKNEMGRVCKGEVPAKFWWGNLRPRRRWEDNIRMDFQEVEWEGINWIDLARDKYRWRALVNTVISLRDS